MLVVDDSEGDSNAGCEPPDEVDASFTTGLGLFVGFPLGDCDSGVFAPGTVVGEPPATVVGDAVFGDPE